MTAPSALAGFQRAFGHYVRDPQQNPCPDQIPPRRARIYEDLLFNNLRGFLNTCFPVSRQLLTEEQWERLAREFFSQWRCHTPYFSQIPQEFVAFIAQYPGENCSALPPWMPALLHYEWIELDVELHELHDFHDLQGTGITPNHSGVATLRTNPTLRNLTYEWPVHRICRQFLPTQPEATCLLVYRDNDLRVQFMEVSPFTAHLVSLVEHSKHTIDSLLDNVLMGLQHPDPSQVRAFGRQQVEEFIRHGIFREDY